MTSHSAPTLRLALPDDEALPKLCEHLRASGFAIPHLQGPGLHRVIDPLGLGVNFEVCKIAPADVGAYVEHGITKLGVMRTDLLSESGAEVWRPFTFSYGSAPLVLAAPRGLTLEHLTSRPYIRLATSLPNRTRDIFAARGLAIEVVPVADSPTACLFGLADGYVDRLTGLPAELLDSLQHRLDVGRGEMDAPARRPLKATPEPADALGQPVTGAIALVVYQWLGVAFLRRGWLNLDRLWSFALVATGLLLLLT